MDPERSVTSQHSRNVEFLKAIRDRDRRYPMSPTMVSARICTGTHIHSGTILYTQRKEGREEGGREGRKEGDKDREREGQRQRNRLRITTETPENTC